MANDIKFTYYEKQFDSENEAVVATGLVGWASLVMGGYGFAGDESYTEAQFLQEYGAKPDKVIFAASEGGKVIGTLALTKTLGLVEGLKSYNVSGVVVAPEYKGHRVSSKLYAEALSTLDIDLLVGNTKEPSAVVSRAKGTHKFGLRTFYGQCEVTPSCIAGATVVHKQYLGSYIEWKGVNPDSDGVYFKEVNILLPHVPCVNGYPENIKVAFTPVIDAQKKVGDSKTAVMPLLSVKSNLLF